MGPKALRKGIKLPLDLRALRALKTMNTETRQLA